MIKISLHIKKSMFNELIINVKEMEFNTDKLKLFYYRFIKNLFVNEFNYFHFLP